MNGNTASNLSRSIFLGTQVTFEPGSRVLHGQVLDISAASPNASPSCILPKSQSTALLDPSRGFCGANQTEGSSCLS